MTKLSLIALLAAVASCGGSSPQPSAPTPAVAPAEPAVPAEPVAPTDATDQPAAAQPDPAKVKADLLAAETAAFEQAKPVFDKYCATCHTKTGRKQKASTREHFDMTTYPFGGHHAMEIQVEIRSVLGLSGKKPTMPPDNKGVVKGDELALIAAWADAFDASHQGGAHEGHGGHEH